jgi:hypothetical protein
MVLLLTRDEYDIIEYFLEYYSWIFGASNIVVVDNGSTNSHVLAVYDKYMKLGITVYSEKRPFIQATNFMSEYVAFYKDKCRFLFPLETDEFITFHDRPTEVFDVQAFHEYLNDIPSDVGTVQYSKVLCSIFEPRHIGEPVLEIDTFFEQKWDKFFVRGATCLGLKTWCHSCFSSGKDVQSQTLSLLHYHNTGAKRAFERSRNIVQCMLPIAPQRGGVRPASDIHTTTLETIEILHELSNGPTVNGHRVHQYLSFLLKQYCHEQFQAYVGRDPTLSEITMASSDVSGDKTILDNVKCLTLNLEAMIIRDKTSNANNTIDLEAYMFASDLQDKNDSPIPRFTINSMSVWLDKSSHITSCGKMSRGALPS